MSIACHSCHCIECQPRQNGYSSSKGWDSSSGHSGTNRCLPRSKSATAPSVCGASKCALLRSLHLDPPLQASGTQRNSKELKAARKWMKYHSSTQICRCTAIFQLMALRELVGGGAAPPQVGSWMPLPWFQVEQEHAESVL